MAMQQGNIDNIKVLFECLEAPWLVIYKGIEVIEFEQGPNGYLELAIGYCIPLELVHLPDLAIVHEHLIDMI